MDDGRDGDNSSDPTAEGNERSPEWPIETAHLCKGDRIPASLVCAGYDVKQSSRAYSMALMRAVDFVYRKLLERGLVAVVVSDHDDIAILTDAEAAEKTDHDGALGLRKMRRALGKQGTVDRSNLTADQVERHDRNLTRRGAIVIAASSAARKKHVLPGPTVRQTPGIGDGKKPEDDK